MRIEYSVNSDIPALAWCARLNAQSDVVRIEGGKCVEHRENWFAAAVWNGDFQSGEFQQASLMAGTAGRINNGNLEIHTGTSNYDPLYIHREEGCVWISNSLAYLMCACGLLPRKEFKFYERIFMQFDAGGLYRRERTVPLQGGGADSYEGCILIFDKNLAMSRQAKPEYDVPDDYHRYVELLREAAYDTVKNAANSNRLSPYGSVMASSRGYDSLAVAAIVRQSGVNHACSFYEIRDNKPYHADNAREALASIGYQASEHLRGYPQVVRPGEYPEAPFCMVPPAMDLPQYNMFEALKNRIRFNGYFGDATFELDSKYDSPTLQFPYHFATTGNICAYEYRLGINCISVVLLSLGWQQRSKLQAMAKSEAFKPWNVPDKYNRPLARRIIVDGGIDEKHIASKKQYGQYMWELGLEKLSPSSREDYLNFISQYMDTEKLRQGGNRKRPMIPYLFQWGFNHHHCCPVNFHQKDI